MLLSYNDSRNIFGGNTMRKEWFEKLQQIDSENETIIQAADLSPYIYDKTLLYGYTCERKTFHVYLKNRELCVVIYEMTIRLAM
jgi:hypothetical protein